MPYKSNEDLPTRVSKHLPEHAKSIYREAFNHAWQQYKDKGELRESTSHKVAWAAVQKKYEKGINGKWAPKKG